MTRFSADWLGLREPFDHAAREAAAAALTLPGWLARWREEATGQPLGVVDLACGTGSNLRALMPRLGRAQRWRLLDHDPALLAALPDALAHWAQGQRYQFALEDVEGSGRTVHLTGPDFAAEITCHRVDLARDLSTLDLAATQLVTASALLDLVSLPWLQALVRRARGVRAALLFALNVDGRTTWDPADRGDAAVQRLFGQHQHRDKGFGPALGPQAPAIALQHLASAGYETRQTQTDWLIDGAGSAAMQLAVIEGTAAAALEQEPSAQGVVASWKARRVASAGATRLRVGHTDIMGTLA